MSRGKEIPSHLYAPSIQFCIHNIASQFMMIFEGRSLIMNGNIHSIETFGTVDGPGIRYVIFTQGCLLRCQFCHNADTWEIGTGKQMSVSEIMNDLMSYLPFIESSGGGITVSGGEPFYKFHS